MLVAAEHLPSTLPWSLDCFVCFPMILGVLANISLPTPMGFWHQHGKIITVPVHQGSTKVVLDGTDGVSRAVMLSERWCCGTWWYSDVLW